MNFFSAQTHGLQDFFLGQATGGDVEHDLFRLDGIDVIINPLKQSSGVPQTAMMLGLSRHGSARLFRLA